MKKALITGITGQDGAYLTKLLLDKGYSIIGGYRHTSNKNFWRLKELGVLGDERLKLVDFDLIDPSSIMRILSYEEFDEVYNLAAQSFVSTSFNQPLTTMAITGVGTMHLLEAIRILNPKIRYYQASSSEMFGKVRHSPQDENTPFYPRSPYAIAKLASHWSTINYRESYGIFACSGILFNHESPLRGKNFVTRKITNSLSRIKLGLQNHLYLGNLNAKRDWGYAKDYMEGIYKMLQMPKADDYVLATNHTVSVKTFLEKTAEILDFDIVWEGTGVNEVGIDRRSNEVLVKIDPKYYRPAEVDYLMGDYSKAKNELDWTPKTTIDELCQIMVEADLQRNRECLLVKN
jgi:GDPmannose 4,6-dehydratase